MRKVILVLVLLSAIAGSYAQQIPDVVLPDLQGKEYDLHSLLDQGKYFGVSLYWTT